MARCLTECPFSSNSCLICNFYTTKNKAPNFIAALFYLKLSVYLIAIAPKSDMSSIPLPGVVQLNILFTPYSNNREEWLQIFQILIIKILIFPFICYKEKRIQMVSLFLAYLQHEEYRDNSFKSLLGESFKKCSYNNICINVICSKSIQQTLNV